MTFKKEDILDALGIEQESSGWLPMALAGFGVGCAVGAAVAILFAPKSGRELREDIKDKGRDLMNRGKDEMANLGLGSSSKSPTTPTY